MTYKTYDIRNGGLVEQIERALNDLSARMHEPPVWLEISASLTAAANTNYLANNSSRVILTLPPLAEFGDCIRVVGKGAGGWRIAQDAGQTIHCGDKNTTDGAGGYIESQGVFDCVKLLCTTQNSNWTVLTMQGNLTII